MPTWHARGVTQVLVVRGSKEFMLFPPSQSQHLYPVQHALGTMYSQAPRAALSACQLVGNVEDERPADVGSCRTDETDALAGAAPPPTSRDSDLHTDGAAPSEDGPAAFPLLRHARGFRCTVRSGDMLYVPVGWWHSVRGSPEMNLTLNYW